jgi:hypothetical protein
VVKNMTLTPEASKYTQVTRFAAALVKHVAAGSPSMMPTHGPGTELSRLLKRLGINPTPTCQCRDKQQEMDVWGPDECERPERIDEVVAVMRAEAEARGLPFLDIAGRLLVRRAIQNARKAASATQP